MVHLSFHSEYDLHLFPQQVGEMIYIESLHTQGDLVKHRIFPTQASLLPQEDRNQAFEKAVLLEQPRGGRGPLALNEKEDLIKTILRQAATVND